MFTESTGKAFRHAALLCALIAAAIACIGSAQAQDTTGATGSNAKLGAAWHETQAINFEIPAQWADAALNEFARQADITLLLLSPG